MINTRQGLAEYSLRQLGGGVVNIEVTDDQITDVIDNAIQSYQEWHFDGIERDYVVRKISATVIGFADVTGFNVNDTLYSADNTVFAKITAIDGSGKTITISRTEGGVFASGQVVHTSTVTKTITSIVLGDVDNKYISVDDTVVGVIRVLNINRLFKSSDYMFNPQYQITMNEMRNLTTGGTQYMYGMMNYLGHLDFMMTKEKDFRFNRRMNKIFLDIDWTNDVSIGDFVTVEVYKALDETVYAEILNDLWLKKYTTALMKKIWGQNLKKYSGMQLPGGMTYNGQQIYDEAVQDLEKLEQQAREESAPLSFMVG
jgi:hypothetical protein